MSITELYCKNIFPFLLEEDGQWIPGIYSIYFKSFKSFGVYQCCCSKIWVSAHARSNYRQSCTECGKFNFSLFMWKNYNNESIPRRGIKNKDRKNKEHKEYLCECCIKNGRKYCATNESTIKNPLPPLLPLPPLYFYM